MARHEPLRARFTTVDGRPEQIVDPPGPVALPLADLRALPEGTRDAEVHRLAVEAARRSFDLARGSLLRAALLRTGQDEWVLLLAMHHIAADGWSIGVLLRELATLYGAFAAGRPAALPPLPPLPISYADYAAWQREHLQGERLRREVEHWRTRLAGIPDLRLPTERRLQEEDGSRGTTVQVVLPPALTQRLKTLARGAGASVFMTLLATFELLLARWTGQSDFGIGAPVANRTRPEIEGLVGFFVNTLVLRADLAGDPSFTELLARVERTAVDAFAHQEIPFDKLVEELQPERRLGRTPFFSAALALLNLPPAAAHLPGLELTPLAVRNDTSRFELTLSLAEEGDALAGDLVIRERTLSPLAARRMAGHLRVLLEAIVADPGAPVSALPLLTAGERHQILVEWAGPTRDYPDRTLSQLFEEQAARTPESIAVVCGPAAITYGDLDRRSNQLARWLRHRGAAPETAVSISVERSVEMVVGLLGILKSGAAYLPIDPLNPRERQAFLLEDAGTSVLLTQERWAPSFQSGFEAPGRHILCLDADWSEVAREEDAPLAPLAGPEHVIALLYTSGSTGRPKATVLDGRGFLNLCLWFRDVCPIAPHTHGLLGFSFSFDAAFKNILVPLLVGGRTVLPPPGPYDAAEMLEAIRREQVTFLNTTPSQMAPVLQLAAAEGWSGLESLETLILGGEAARWAELRPWMESGRCRAEILHMYGPSEVSDTVSCHRSHREEIAVADRLPVGRAADNTRMVVVEADPSGGLQPLPIGVPGELCLGGDGVGRGYLARPELTAEKFVPDPFQAGRRMYRTGDLARWRPDGSLEILGRIDHQVKIRGIRVEPPEVEAALAAHPAVGGAVVAAREDAAGEKRLIAWMIPREEASFPSRGALRDFLRERLPEVMIPAAFVPLDAFPVNTRGKIDRAALPDPMDEGAGEEAGDEPRGTAEELMAELWADVLGRGRIGRRDDFFHLGGHSLLATRLTARVRAAFGVELPVRRLFEHPTVAELTEEVRRLAGQGLPTAPPLLPGPRGHVRGDVRGDVGNSTAPLSFAQRRLWMLHQLSLELTAYHIPAGLRLRGPLRAAVLESALAEIVRRHESLRTAFPIVDGEPRQAVAPADRGSLPGIDLSALPEDVRDVEARRIAVAESRRPFDLERGPLLRLLLLRLAPEDHVLFLVVHHLVSDGWSTAIFLRELSLFYRQIPLPEPVLQYADWARWQREWLRGEVLETQLRWWRERLDSAPRVLDLPTDFPRPPVESPAGAAVPVRLPEDLVGALRALGRAEGATLYMVLLGAFQVLLARRAGEATVCAGTHVAGRDRLETERLIGFFVNTLVIRTDLDGAPSGKELIAQVREAVLGAFAHQDLPFERLVEALNPVRDLRWSPLFQAAFTLQNAPREELLLPGLEVEPLEVDNGTTQLDLALTLFETAEGAAGGLRYRTALFAEPTIRRLAGHYEVFLRALVEDPGRCVLDLPLLTPEERARILDWSGEGLAVPSVEETFAALFEAQVDRTPDAPAVTHGGRTLTYRELDRQANRLARSLRRRGVGPEARVAIRFQRSVEMLVAVLGIWKAGGAYVPIDPATPPERLAFLHQDAAAVLELTGEEMAGLDLTAESEERLGVPAVPGQLAYVIYTSGSTGRPKGTLVSQGSLMAFAGGLETVFRSPSTPGVVALNASLAFDASLQMILQLLAGHSLWLVPEEARRDEEQMADFLRAAEPDAIDCTPSQLELLLAAMDAVDRPPRVVLVGGEPIPPGLWSRLAAHPVTRFWNVYGPTECTVDVTARLIEGDLPGRPDLPDLGRPLPGVRACLLEASGQSLQTLAPAGARAEIWIGGPQVARGYLGRPDLTADRFRPDPVSGVLAEPGARLYRTGDLARWLPDGRIDLLGRADQQVKLRGHRVELGEIEAHLLAHPDIREAAAGVRPDARGHQRLVAWIVPVVPGSPDLRELRHWLGQRLPDAMLPSAFAVLGSLPINASGKLDRRALPDPERGVASRVRDRTAPSDEVEEKLLALFREVLEVDAVEPTDNLFELGGHSMSVFRLATRIRESFGLRIAVSKIFTSPTPAGLAEVLRGMDREAGLPRVRRVPREGPLPLSLQQQRLWVLHQLAPESTAYHIPAGLRLRGPLDVPALERALSEIVRRHEVLRTSFPLHGGEPIQRIAPIPPIASAAPVLLPVLDLLEEEVPLIAEAEARRPFDLERGPLLRLALLRTAPDSHVLLLVVHHLVSDGWSAALFLRELSALYTAAVRNEPSPLPELPVQYADWAVWQREHLRGEVLDTHLRWWAERLADAPRVLDFPTDRPRPPLEDPAGATLEMRLPETLVDSLRRLALGENATLYMALLAGFQALLARRAGEDTVCVGTHLARRNRLEVEALIGFFVNTVVIRADFAGRPDGRDLIAQVRETVFGAFAHQDIPFERLVHALDPDRDPRWSPLFQVSFSLQNAPHEAPCLPGLEVELLETDTGAAQFDLAVALSESGAGAIRYRTALFQESTIDRLARHYETLLRGMAEQPGRSVLELPLLADEERDQVLGEWGGSETLVSIGQLPETFPMLFEAQVDRTPDAPAVTFAGTTLTFRDLDRRANRLARHLRRQGVEAETRVAIRLERSPEMLVALLGIWKAGGAYVPFDPATPPERLAWLREDAGATLELTDADLAALDLSAESEERLALPMAPEQLAYVIYTSGSTGRPKGTLVSQGALVAFWRGLTLSLGEGEGLRVSLNAPLLFDASLQQIVQLLSGRCLWIVPEEARRDVDRLAGFLREADLDGFDCTPSQLEVLLAAIDLSGRPPRFVLVGGEPISPALWRRLATHPRTRFWNVYGPTECTVDATARPIHSNETEELPDAGRPLPGYRLRLFEATGPPIQTLAPSGARAEVWIGGPALARGYLGRPELTADRFRPDPFSSEPGARLYRTGDLGRWRHSPGDSGRIEILGRADQQVKLRGVRIELGEIEAALTACPGVREAVVGVLETRETREAGAGPILAAWVTSSGSTPPDPDELRRRLHERLSEVMVPSSFTLLEALPRTASGKLDRRALPAPERGLAGRGGRAAPPRDAIELRLAEIVQELLGLEEIGVQESFFDLGGHSLAAVRLVGRIREVFGTALPVAALFQAPTVEALAALVRHGGEIARSPLVPLRAGEGPPLFLIHPGGGSVFAYLDLVHRLEGGRPVFGLQALGLEAGEEPLRDAGEIAERYLAEIWNAQSAGPWHLAGWSFGGIVAFEMARRLRARGEEVAALVLIDPTDPRAAGALPPDEIGLLAAFARELGISLEALGLTEDEARALAPEQRWVLLFEKGREAGRLRPGDDLADLHRRFEVFRAHAEAARAFRPGPYDGPLDLIEAAERPAAAGSWRDLARRTVVLPGDHFSLMTPPGVDALAAAVRERI